LILGVFLLLAAGVGALILRPAAAPQPTPAAPNELRLKNGAAHLQLRDDPSKSVVRIDGVWKVTWTDQNVAIYSRQGGGAEQVDLIPQGQMYRIFGAADSAPAK
jgi:hypothetical protein